MRRGGRRWALAVPAAALIAVAWWWAHPADAVQELRARTGLLAGLSRSPLPELGPGFERWRMVASGGDTVVGLWRAPAGRAGPARGWTVVMLGGIGTDDRAALLVPDSLPAGVLAVSWPWRGPRRMSRLAFLGRVPTLRRALYETPGAIALGVQAVRRACPTCRVALLGASLGAPPTAAALSLARVDAVVLVDGAADLDRLLRSEVDRSLGGGIVGAILGPPAGSLGARLLSSLEPMRHAAAAREVPALLVDAESEARIPPGCVQRLHETFPQADRATHPGGHLRPENSAQIASLIETIWGWLRARPDPRAAARAS